MITKSIKALPLCILEKKSLPELMDYANNRGHEICADTIFKKTEWIAQIHRLDNDKQINPMEKDYSQC
jgi:hypothetical protein